MQSIPPERRRDLILSLNTHKGNRPLAPIEVANLFEQILKGGATYKELADFVNFDSTSTLREIHRLLSLAPEIRELVGWGRSGAPLSMTAASHIARLKDQADQEAVAHAGLTHGFTSEETRQVVETKIHSGQPVARCVETVLRLRPRIERKDLLIGAVTSENLRNRLSQMTQRERDEVLRNAMSQCVAGLPEWVGSLSAARFTLLGDETFGQRIRALPDGFESAINSCLEAQIQDHEQARR